MDRTQRMPVARSGGDAADDSIVVEEPLEIRVGERPVSVTMRTPGDDTELAAGFLFTEAIIDTADAIDSMRHWGSANVIRVALREGTKIDLQRLQRHFYSASSCGICGKASIDAIRVHAKPIESPLRVRSEVLARLPDLLRHHQSTFHSTGGLHAAGLFRADGSLILLREDVGRHNAVDKVIGAQFLEHRTPLRDDILLVSGRAGFEIAQKAAVAGIPILASVGAPSSLAVELAREFGMTLAGFVRDGGFNVYTGQERIHS